MMRTDLAKVYFIDEKMKKYPAGALIKSLSNLLAAHLNEYIKRA
jgi:hypothetical protein